MTRDYQGIGQIRAALARVRTRRRLVRTAADIGAAVAAAAAALLVLFLTMGYWPAQPPTALRWLCLVVLSGTWVAAAVWLVRRMVRSGQSLAEVARFVEQARPELRNDLINSVLLSADRHQSSRYFVQRAIHESVARLRKADIDTTVSRRTAAQRLAVAGAGLVVLAALVLLQPQAMARALTSALTPTRYVPHDNRLELTSLSPGDTTCFAGTAVTVVAGIRNEPATALAGQVLIDGQAEPKVMMVSDRFSTFACRLGRAEQTFRYAVRVGRSRWPADKPWYTVTVVQRVEVKGLDLDHTFPAYTGRKPEHLADSDGHIEAPLGTRTRVTLRLGRPVPRLRLHLGSRSPLDMTPLGDGAAFAATVPVLRDGSYRIALANAAGIVVQQLPENGAAAADNGSFRIRAIPDTPPRIRFVVPAVDATVAPNGRLPTRLSVSDDHGLSSITFFAAKEGKPFEAVHAYRIPADFKSGRLEYEFPAIGFTAGDVITYYAAATDNRRLPAIKAGPQTAATAKFRIRIEDPAKAAADKARWHEELQRRLRAILKMQESQRVNTGLCLEKHVDLPAARKIGAAIRTGQTRIRAALAGLVENFPFDPETAGVKRAVAMLAGGEATLAIEQAGVVATLAALSPRGSACAALADSQDKVLDALQTLLGLLPSLSRKADPARKSAEGSDLPDDAKARLRNLTEKLEEFLQAQKKVIEATRDLAKKPVDTFTPDDEAVLKALMATEDQWEKFLNEAFKDMSKLQEQDFSNPALLKELVSIKSDVTMAKDALAKQAIDMATAAEENGYGNAEEIKHNMEKWLPDEPDRKKWDMEDPTDQANMEMPELPAELEDMMGDLLEEEEDLFDEMQDTSSKHGGSMDAGWDATDGPISTPNADGVTGNQLPNSNEMQGRSAEGRQGKSSGEYVQDTAVGKGGRRTPNRLTPDSFQKGQVDDKSSQPPGGATGGGKLSGSGQEGLEGPVPPPLAKELKRMAGKQAQLLNRAERMQTRFQAGDYANFKFLQAITLMNRVKKDLETGRYTSALRARKDTLSALKQAHDVLTGRIDVEADASAAMPKYIRDNIADAMKGNLPAEYRDALEQYYRRLGQAP